MLHRAILFALVGGILLGAGLVGEFRRVKLVSDRWWRIIGAVGVGFLAAAIFGK